MAATPRTEQALTTLTPAQMTELDAYADREEISRAEAIRRFILDGVQRKQAVEAAKKRPT